MFAREFRVFLSFCSLGFNNKLLSSSSSSSSSSCLNNGRERALSFKSSSSSSSSFPLQHAFFKPSLKSFSSCFSAAFRQTTSLLSSASTTTTRTQLQNNNFITSSAQKKRSYVGVVVEDGNVDRAMRRMKRTMINEKMFDAFKERLGQGRDAGFKKPSEKRVLALKERDRRVFKKKLKQKIGWILRRRERGF